MQLKTKYILALLTLTIFAISCKKIGPANFWTNYQKKLIQECKSNQGPYGGHREIYWKSSNKNTFTSKELFDFATKNGWEFSDSVSFSADILKKWEHKGLTFPFTYTDFSDKTMSTSTFSRWITSDINLYRFKTGWIAIEPGNLTETDKNGYIVISSDGTELSIYHLWGE